MATLGSRFVDLIDIYRDQGAAGTNAAMLIELLAQSNPILNDAIAVECNDGLSHLTSMRTGLPNVSWGQLYKGVKQSKSASQQVRDTTGFVEGRSEIDERVLDLAGDKRAQVKLNEDTGFIEAMTQEVGTGMFYHDTATTPEKLKGFSARFNRRGTKDAPNAARQVVHGGGAGSDNTSVWFVTWGERFCHTIYPKGSMAGLQRIPRGNIEVLDGNGDPYFAEVDTYRWHIGLSVRDWRYVSRIANIDVSDLRAGTVDPWPLMRQAYYRLHSRQVTRSGANFQNTPITNMRQVIYMNSDMLEALDANSTERGGDESLVRLQRREIEGQEVQTYRGIPIMESDAILNTEALVPSI